MLTVVEFYKPYWSHRQPPMPTAYANRNAAIKAAAQWSSELAVDKLGKFEARHLKDACDSIEFLVIYDDWIGNHVEEVALLFDVEVIH